MSEKQDLLKAAKTLGCKGVNTSSNLADLRKAINEKLGVPDSGDDDLDTKITESYAATVLKAGSDAVAAKTGPVVASSRNIPNLSPNGKWEGKRARIKRTMTGHNDMMGAIFNWNGWPTIIPIDAVVDVAWPIYEIILNCTGMDMDIRQEDDPRDRSKVRNIKNITYYEKYPFQFMGITPGTEDLPESPWEYTLDAYVNDFPEYTVRMWRQLCVLWEISDDQASISPGLGPDQEIVCRRNSVHYLLNLPQGVDVKVRKQVRNEKRSDIGMEAKAA